MPLCYHCFREKANEGPCPFCGYDGAEQAGKYPRALRPGTILNGRYIVGRVLGQGGFGITYLAQDYQSKERAAIKEYFPAEFVARATDAVSVLADSANQGQNFDYGKTQFLEEARTLSNFIGNEHIVRIHRYFEENGTAYFVMEFIEGPSLDKYMRQFGGHLGVKEAKHLLLPLMEAMGEVHEKGIVHRDIAPDNIIVTGDGTAKLIDFGAARYSTGEKSKSLDVILKHGFAPYEQYMRRGRQGPWTDVYAMAATFYYAVTGKVPPEATERKEEDTLIPPSTFGVKIDDATEEALLKALEVRAADRFQSMADFCAAMRGEAPVVRKPQSAPRDMEGAAAPARRPAGSTLQPNAETGAAPNAGKKKSKLPLALAAVLVLAAVIFGVTRLGGSKAENPAVPEVPTPATAEPVIETPEPTPHIPVYTLGYVMEHYKELDGQTFYIEGYISSKALQRIYLVDSYDLVHGSNIDENTGNKDGLYDTVLLRDIADFEYKRIEQFLCASISFESSELIDQFRPYDRVSILCQLNVLKTDNDGNKLAGGRCLSFTPYEISLVENNVNSSDNAQSIPAYSVGYVLEHYEELDGQTFYMEGYVSSIYKEFLLHLVDSPDLVLGYVVEPLDSNGSYITENYPDYARNEEPRQKKYQSMTIGVSREDIAGIIPGDKVTVLGSLEIKTESAGNKLVDGERLIFTDYEITLADSKNNPVNSPPVKTYTVGYVLQHYEELNGETFYLEGYLSSLSIGEFTDVGLATQIYLVEKKEDVVGYSSLVNSKSLRYLEKAITERNNVAYWKCFVVRFVGEALDWLNINDRVHVLCTLEDLGEHGNWGGYRLVFTPYEPYEITVIE